MRKFTLQVQQQINEWSQQIVSLFQSPLLKRCTGFVYEIRI